MARLADPLTINGIRLRNRLALPPIVTGYGTREGEVTSEQIGFYRQRSRDVGLVVVEATAVRADGRLSPRNLGLWNDDQLQGMARLAQAIKGEGAAAVVQLNHAGARSVPVGEGIRRASPSDFAFGPEPEPTVMNRDQIAEVVSSFADAAGRAATAGFDGVEIHGAHLFLISQFLSPLTNRRQDRYGGDAAGRATFALEVVRGLRRRLGAGYPILFRLNAVEIVEGGQTLEESAVAAELLREAGVNAFHASIFRQTGWREVGGRRYIVGGSALSKEQPAGANAPYAARIKRAAGLPTIAVGKLGEASAATRVLEEGLADVVAIARQMIADPETAGKMLSGRSGEIVRCKECMACFASAARGEPVKCATNRNLTGRAEYLPQ